MLVVSLCTTSNLWEDCCLKLRIHQHYEELFNNEVKFVLNHCTNIKVEPISCI